jgi:hypothetical protein
VRAFTYSPTRENPAAASVSLASTIPSLLCRSADSFLAQTEQPDPFFTEKKFGSTTDLQLRHFAFHLKLVPLNGSIGESPAAKNTFLASASLVFLIAKPQFPGITPKDSLKN